jgi:hypothetical protein
MRIVQQPSEDEVIRAFVRAEWYSPRFSPGRPS